MSYKYQLILGFTCVVISSLGCRSPYHQDRLAGVGGVAGAVTGAAIGEASGNPAGGAIIGSVVGAMTGSAIGESLDEAEARNQMLIEQRLGHQLAGATTFQDVIAMSQAGLGDNVIVTHLNHHGVVNRPTPQDLIHLKNSGVSDTVLSALQKPPTVQATAVAPVSRPVIIEEHHYVPGPHYYHRPHHRHRASWGVSVHH